MQGLGISITTFYRDKLINKVLEKKMLTNFRRESLKTKSVISATKMNNSLQGHIQQRKVRCGKSNCKCANGKPHTAFYRVWIYQGFKFQKYVRKADLESVRRACEVYRRERKQMTSAHIQFRQIMNAYRQILREEYKL